MKRALLAILLAALLPTPSFAKVKVVTTTSDMADAVRAVGGDRVEVKAIAPGQQDPHQVETKPSYLTALRDADAFVMTGLDLEVAWAPDLLRNSRNAKIQPGGPAFLNASTGINVLQKPKGQVDRTMGDVHPLGNPHYTMSPTNQLKVARNVTALLKAVDPAGAATYDKGYKDYYAQIDAASKRWKAKLAPYAGRKIVTYHSTWPYFAAYFKLEVIGTVEPKPGISPSAAYLDGLAEQMKSGGVKVILAEPWYPNNLVEAISRRSNAKVLRLPIQPGGAKGADTYIQMMDLVVNQIAEALK